MSRVIVEIRNPADDADRRLMMWCTIVDAPITFGMDRETFGAWYREWDVGGGEDLGVRLARVDVAGTSAAWAHDWREVVGGNRAGPDESLISVSDIWRHYVANAPEDVTVPCCLPKAGGAL
jgi:hypothetical protein